MAETMEILNLNGKNHGNLIIKWQKPWKSYISMAETTEILYLNGRNHGNLIFIWQKPGPSAESRVPFMCTVCGKSFKTGFEMKKHSALCSRSRFYAFP
jgi:hypothetical protein